MSNLHSKTVYLKSKTTGHIYSTEDGVTYFNHTTLKGGQIPPEKAKEYFSTHVRLNEAINANKCLLDLIELGLAIE